MSAPHSPPPTAPKTYQEALAVAAAAIAAQKAPKPTAEHARDVTAAAAESIIAARERAAEHAKQAIRKLWATVNPYSAASRIEFAAKAARIMGSAQTAAAKAAAVGQAQQLAAIGIKVSAAQSVPVDIRAKTATIAAGKLVLHRPTINVDYSSDSAKVTAADMTTAAIFERPAETYRYVVSQGGTDAAEQSNNRIDSLVDDNLMLAQRLAQQQVLSAAEKPPTNLDRPAPKSKIIGYRRVIHPELSRSGTCGMCIAASDRIYKVGELLPIHANCKCTIAAVTEDYDPADDLNAVDLNQLYKQAGGTSAAHLKRTRYKIDEHGELGPVLVPKRKYKPRSAASNKGASGTGVTDATPESKAEVAARHLPLLQNSLADLRARGVAEDSPQVTYHKQQIARMQADIEKGTAATPAKGRAKATPRRDTPATAPGISGNEPPTRPPGDNGPISAEEPDDGLNRLFGEQSAAADTQIRASVQRWQQLGRYYEQVQAAVKDNNPNGEAVRVALDLQLLAAPLPEDVQVWRGIRSIEATFGAPIDQLESQPGEIVNRFMSTTAHESVARDEFLHPGPQPALLKVTARSGARAVWMPPIGDPEMAYQGELLFAPGHLLRILRVDREGDPPLIEVEVSEP